MKTIYFLLSLHLSNIYELLYSQTWAPMGIDSNTALNQYIFAINIKLILLVNEIFGKFCLYCAYNCTNTNFFGPKGVSFNENKVKIFTKPSKMKSSLLKQNYLNNSILNLQTRNFARKVLGLTKEDPDPAIASQFQVIRHKVSQSYIEKMEKFKTTFTKLYFKEPKLNKQGEPIEEANNQEFIDSRANPTSYEALHEYEVYLQDSVDLDFPSAKNLNINPKFVLKGDFPPSTITGYCTLKGTEINAQRAPEYVNYHEIALPDGTQKLSQNSFSVVLGGGSQIHDFYQYNALKTAVINGGVNRLEGSYFGRDQRGERLIGAALHTLIKKYGFSREEFFLTSRQGFTGIDSVEGIPDDLTIEELSAKYPGLKSEYLKDSNYCNIPFNILQLYCFHPLFLHHCLDSSLKRLNVETIDCVLLQRPFEQLSTSLSQIDYYTKIARTFEYYERCRQAGMIRSYGITAGESLCIEE